MTKYLKDFDAEFKKIIEAYEKTQAHAEHIHSINYLNDLTIIDNLKRFNNKYKTQLKELNKKINHKMNGFKNQSNYNYICLEILLCNISDFINNELY